MSKEELIFSGSTVEELAEAFSELVSRNYLTELNFWRMAAIKEVDDSPYWENRIEEEPKEIKLNAYAKTLSIMQYPDRNKQFFKRRGFLRRRHVISITRSSGFYDNLLPRRDVKHTVTANIEYLIDPESFCIKKKTYSEYVRL